MAKPRIGDSLHFVNGNRRHLPALVLVEAPTPHGNVTLVAFGDPSETRTFQSTINGGSVASLSNVHTHVPFARAGEDVTDTWHWPERRTPPEDI